MTLDIFFTFQFCDITLLTVMYLPGFHLIVCGLDSIVARRWINGMVVCIKQLLSELLQPSTLFSNKIIE